ncbi:hypothetical protein DL93DRAFT_2158167 [Clavulina sp. PMI_390]|nr:hypothetical protein DL93DRAFT_2158167 [Clavulina sp. PMI_390]
MADPTDIPRATQAQIMRAAQKDVFNVFTLREDSENVLRAWLGTRWLTRWSLEVDLLAKLIYYGLTTLRGTQTLGEEYTDIRRIHSTSRRFPRFKLRLALILLPTLPPYILSRFSRRASSMGRSRDSLLARLLRASPGVFELLAELNLAAFYIGSGSVAPYTIAERVLGIRHMASTPSDPNQRPPSYSLLGILLAIRLIYRIQGIVSSVLPKSSTATSSPIPMDSSSFSSGKTSFGTSNPVDHSSSLPSIDNTPIAELVPASLLARIATEGDDGKDHWGDRTVLSVEELPSEVRTSHRRCALCLEERTASTVTECGHLFCWTCIVGWGREKAECPLCRQSLALSKLIPLHNL